MIVRLCPVCNHIISTNMYHGQQALDTLLVVHMDAFAEDELAVYVFELEAWEVTDAG